MSRANGARMKDYLFDENAGWIPGVVTPSGFAILFLLFIMGLFSHRLVRKSGRFEVTIKLSLLTSTLPYKDSRGDDDDNDAAHFPTALRS